MHLEEWLRRIQLDHMDRILPITDRIAIEWGRISALRPRGDADGLIAATAVVHDFIIVTRNVRDFDDTGVSLIDPWNNLA
jgi:predicted nucleic acid-binding protein